MEEKKMSFGEEAVGLTFNPGNDPNVQKIKELYAEIIDFCKGMTVANLNTEAIRLFEIAITEAQGAQMWAVKAITWK